MGQSTLTARAALPAVAPQNTSQFRADIQGLRAVAVLAVVFDHLLSWPQGGFVGVDIFFVISGFLITSLLIKDIERSGSISFIGFYKRRAKRILPASLLVLLVTCIASYFLLPVSRADATRADALWALVFSGNWKFAIGGTDYFQEGLPPSPLQHFWSLGVEEQFYFIWPWLMLLVAWVVATRTRGARTGRSAMALLMVVIIIASFTWAMLETATSPTWAYFSTFSRAWELGIGALIAVVAPILTKLPSWLRPVLAWLGVGGLIASVLYVSPGAGFPAPYAAFPVAATAAIIVAGTGGRVASLWLLTNRVMGYLGDISYSLYLWHWPVIILLVAFMPDGNPTYYLTALAVSAVLSVASYHFVEKPTRNFSRQKTCAACDEIITLRQCVKGGNMSASRRFSLLQRWWQPLPWSGRHSLPPIALPPPR
ncbi:acyltransferase family protein [Arthrobacter sp. SAFR-014]|uniref:acyltransferase family protein n=1 Tax=unclassified Arthrobacter TaxID=235627 RepID=UPI003F7CCB67